MKVLNYGSLNIDHVYQVDTIVQPGQTIALARAGVPRCNVPPHFSPGLLFFQQTLPFLFVPRNKTIAKFAFL